MIDFRQNKNKIKKVVNKEDKLEKGKKKSAQKSKSASKGFYYSFLTVILILCLIQITISAVLNVSKVVSYKAKIIQITQTLDAAKSLNFQLKDSIDNFSNASGLEAIARNNLKMSSEDEVLVIINTPKTELQMKEERNKKMGFLKHD